MPNRITMAKQRRIIARLILELLQRPTETHLGTPHYASRCDDIVLMCAITIGQIDKRPMTAAKLADYAGMPRATVARKVREFEKAGMVEVVDGAVLGVISHLNPDGIVTMVETMTRAIHRAAVELSKMDK